jgi:hypothetical protein
MSRQSPRNYHHNKTQDHRTQQTEKANAAMPPTTQVVLKAARILIWHYTPCCRFSDRPSSRFFECEKSLRIS